MGIYKIKEDLVDKTRSLPLFYMLKILVSITFNKSPC
jgi:hypothetical protein